ncbi:15895_t:CDS:1 [Cetraspora pellucida]|uniref:15895_t:CDS:1 n=1 Tax=Cetraspora pellucida TaxID=1433469 RepID=A0A9N9FUM7_9GLOM|nr:15895_t:CDS:1 [Cetraspora pellucida]
MSRNCNKVFCPLSKNHRSDFLKTPEHPIGLELNIYYPYYGFAIEVQIQHEKYIKFFHKEDLNNFIKQQKWYQLKKELCKENWIVLRYIWYYKNPYVVIPEYL